MTATKPGHAAPRTASSAPVSEQRLKGCLESASFWVDELPKYADRNQQQADTWAILAGMVAATTSLAVWPVLSENSTTLEKVKALLATVRPRDVAGRIRRQLAAELLADIVALDHKLKDSEKRLTEAVAATDSKLPDLYGIGPIGTPASSATSATSARFRTRAHFASWTGTAPIDASSGQQIRHRLSRAGNRRLNRVLHIMAIVQLRHDTDGRAYYRRKLAAGKTPMEALRCLIGNYRGRGPVVRVMAPPR